jgi:hypothetical protein
MSEKTLTVILKSDELDAEEVAEAISRLRSDLKDAGFEVRPAPATSIPPPGAKGVDLAVTALEIVVASSMHVAFTQLLETWREKLGGKGDIKVH